eukprot:15440630-Alexandrium_andersonii.AAC.1
MHEKCFAPPALPLPDFPVDADDGDTSSEQEAPNRTQLKRLGVRASVRSSWHLCECVRGTLLYVETRVGRMLRPRRGKNRSLPEDLDRLTQRFRDEWFLCKFRHAAMHALLRSGSLAGRGALRRSGRREAVRHRLRQRQLRS